MIKRRGFKVTLGTYSYYTDFIDQEVLETLSKMRRLEEKYRAGEYHYKIHKDYLEFSVSPVSIEEKDESEDEQKPPPSEDDFDVKDLL